MKALIYSVLIAAVGAAGVAYAQAPTGAEEGKVEMPGANWLFVQTADSITTDGKTIYELSEVGNYADGVLFKVEMQVDPDNVQDAFDAMQDEIEVDGDAPFVFDGEFPEMNE